MMRIALLLTVALAGCSTVRPFVPAPIPPTTATQPPMRPGLPPDGNPTPMTPPSLRDNDNVPLIKRQCRGASVPRQYVVVSYEQSTACPKVVNENEYTVAVIERISDKQIGAFMTVCGDQVVPRGWARDYQVSAEVACPGARVSAGNPTAIVITKQR